MTNRLGREKSPYLLQHKDNPIPWYAWGEEAFKAARDRGVPVFLSIGYSTCHWCHVMAHESFEDQEVAEALNRNFVSIKVDREERPDVDEVYMKALQALTGGGGWPMSVWLTPEGKPFFAGTYYQKHRFLQLLRRIAEVWANQRESLVKDSEQLLTAMTSSSEEERESASNAAERKEFLATYINHFHYAFDEDHGGFGSAPKFPQTMNLMLMMRQDAKTGLNRAEEMVTSTLSHMLRGGVYDQLAGGFHRYSVDQRWLVPHFEKMLYDQAMIVLTLLDAQALYPHAEFERVARETLDYVLAEMTHSRGGFFSAQDADSLNPVTGHSEEGHFATYTYAELENTLTPGELELVSRAFGVTREGQFEGRNILHLQEGFGGSLKSDPLIVSAFSKLRALRRARPAPHLDDKIIVAWNGWMILAMLRAGRELGEPRYIEAAWRAWNFLNEELWIMGEGLRRFWRDGKLSGAVASSEDYAALILSGIELSSGPSAAPENAGGVAKRVLELQAQLDRNFWNDSEGVYFLGDGRDQHLPLRGYDDHDGVTPGANSMAAYNLLRLNVLTGDPAYGERAERIVQRLFPKLKRYPSSLPFLGLAMDYAFADPMVAVYTPTGWPERIFSEQTVKPAPYVLWLPAGEGGWPVACGKEDAGIYICKQGVCLRPAHSPEDARRLLTS